MPYYDINSHRGMALDAIRNEHYYRALGQLVTPSTVVADIGAGVGVHGLMAARLGARHVYLVEPEGVINTAMEAAQKNALQDRVTCIQSGIEDVVLPEQVDIIVSVFTGNFLLTEDLLPLLFLARDRSLRPGGHLVPNAGRMMAMLVNASELFDTYVAAWCQQQCGVDLSVACSNAANSVHYIRDETLQFQALSEPQVLHTLDFLTATEASCNSTFTVEVAESGPCQGILGWSEISIGNEWLSTGPSVPTTHWAMAFLPLDPPLDLQQGEHATIHIRRPEFGDWTWRVSSGSETRSHSEFFGKSMTPALLRKTSDSYRSELSLKGQMTRHVLDSIDQRMTADEICKATYARFGDSVGTKAQLRLLVKRLVSKYG